jgi:tRNA 2-selenouridine synthase
MFDSLLLSALARLDLGRPVWVEAESNRVGNVFLPPALWARLRAAEVMELRVPVARRVQHLVEEYAAICQKPEWLKEKLRQFVSRHGPRRIEMWCAAVDAGAWEALVESLLAVHYDPAYASSARKSYPHVTRTVDLPDVAGATLDELAGRLHPVPTEPPAGLFTS